MINKKSDLHIGVEDYGVYRIVEDYGVYRSVLSKKPLFLSLSGDTI